MTRWFGLTKSALKRQQTNKEVGANPAFYDLSRQRNNTKDEVQEKLNILTAQIEILQEQNQNMQKAMENITSLIIKKNESGY
uniref:Uncharacterized protein n=1 Tax=Acrobeloides nanus TaxID=290746 RepID=A0A914EJP2_9BILA